MGSGHVAMLPPGQLASNNTVATEKLPPGWAAEILTPEQFFVPARDTATSWTGERRLLFAVLEEAMVTFFRYKDLRTAQGKRLFREVCEWFWSEERNYLGAFETICDHLHLDADYMRAGLTELQTTEQGAACPLPVFKANRIRRAA